jgi:hypothetical protein
MRGGAAGRVRLAAAMGIVVASCRGEPRPAVGTGSSGDAPAAVSVAAPVPAWHVIPWEPHAGVDPGDLGTGVVFLTRAEDKGAPTGTDTLLLRAAPDESAPAIGAMLFTVGANGVTQYAVAAPDSLRPNLVEHGYEESGVPFDSADASGRWVHGILGFTRDGAARTGWADTRQRGVGLIRWAEQLADRPIFFPRPEAAAFFSMPDSATPARGPAGDADAYAMHPVEARGPWLRVRVVTPSDNCEPDPAPRRTRELWIRYLDARGRPNVWYYARGC